MAAKNDAKVMLINPLPGGLMVRDGDGYVRIPAGQSTIAASAWDKVKDLDPVKLVGIQSYPVAA